LGTLHVNDDSHLLRPALSLYRFSKLVVDMLRLWRKRIDRADVLSDGIAIARLLCWPS
jgi:hypothetical protein